MSTTARPHPQIGEVFGQEGGERGRGGFALGARGDDAFALALLFHDDVAQAFERDELVRGAEGDGDGGFASRDGVTAGVEAVSLAGADVAEDVFSHHFRGVREGRFRGICGLAGEGRRTPKPCRGEQLYRQKTRDWPLEQIQAAMDEAARPGRPFEFPGQRDLLMRIYVERCKQEAEARMEAMKDDFKAEVSSVVARASDEMQRELRSAGRISDRHGWRNFWVVLATLVVTTLAFLVALRTLQKS
ncbi:MAG: hypothetical protein ACREIA_26975 [Opitutaceae bacterium]